jgi:hypothetical protein
MGKRQEDEFAHMKMLKVLDPNAFEMLMLPSPCFATIKLANRLGREVPAAVNVRPMMSSGMVRMQPIVSAEFIMNSARKASQRTEMIIVAGYHLVYFSKRTSGTVLQGIVRGSSEGGVSFKQHSKRHSMLGNERSGSQRADSSLTYYLKHKSSGKVM